MFCHNCGKEISTDARFCCYCAAENKFYSCGVDSSEHLAADTSNPNQAVTVSENAVEKAEKNFNRMVLVNYLENVQTLEFAKNKLTEEKLQTEDRINNLGWEKDIRPRTSLWYLISDSFFGMLFLVVVFALTLLIKMIVDNWFINIVNVVSAIWFVFIVFEIIKEYFEDGQRYDDDILYEEERLEAEEIEKKELCRILPLIKRDLNSTERLLAKAYSINLIPGKFRNIYGAYFLYDYMSTSNSTLSEALYQCVLEEISNKLDKIIDQQREMIMELARANALNKQIVEQNDRILRSAIAIEKNTALAAQYAQVAAVNSETVSQIQSYYFFKND